MAKNRCYRPIHGYFRDGAFIPSGKRGDAVKGFAAFGIPFSVACGKCLGCRKESARQWAVRMMHESQMHEESAFLTLTYNEDNVPFDRGLDRKAVPDFFKRLRKRIGNKKIRYFQCGEYGAEGNRPHYHIALFGHNFGDREPHTVRDGNVVFRSAELESLWPFGFSEIGTLTFGSATYIARYVTKKLSNDPHVSVEEQMKYAARYERYCDRTGEVYEVTPEHATMSLRPAIGLAWIKKFWRDVYPGDSIVVNGKEARPPRYYDKFMDFPDEKGGSPERRKLIDEVRAARLASLSLVGASEHMLRMSEVCATKEMEIFTERRFER